MLLAGDRYSSIFPWTIPTAYALAVRRGDAVLAELAPSWIALAVTFAIGTLLLFVQIRHADVSG